MSKLTTDEVHVLLDALAALRSDISSHVQGWHAPWEGYIYDDDSDPKITEEGYMGLVAQVSAKLDDYLSSATDGSTT
jgi:hypothetical protein